ncbi:acyltransferase [Avibacterium avium]|uniref:acyltransferase n=1 Tax=Avibacterium avium TaxID=751 RepID=UPI003BF7E6DF
MNQSINHRHYGIDLLKVIAMLMIIALHTLGHGGVLGATKSNDTYFFISNYSIAWFLEIGFYGAVNCYAMTSGYLSWNTSVKYAKLLYLWLQVAFYSLGITFIFSFFINISLQQWLDPLLPITSSQYWYATAYFGLFLLMPILNAYLQSVSQSQIKWHLLILFIFLTLLPLALKKSPYYLNNGYSMLWLCLMYLLGGAIAKCQLKERLTLSQCIKLFFTFVILTWANKMIIEYVNQFIGVKIPYYNLISYISPTIILSSLFLFLCFSKFTLHFRYKKIITILANASFGVYLIHDNGLVRQHLVAGYARSFAQNNALIMIMEIIGCIIAIYLCCFMIDFLRNELFKKLKLYERIKVIDSWIAK